MENRSTNQTVGNAGLYYVCFKLSQLGWNVLPTSRNAKGVDIVAYNQDATRYVTVQVKSLSKPANVLLGKDVEHFMADLFVVCVGVASGTPACSIMTSREVKNFCTKAGNDHVLSPKCYGIDRFRENWKRFEKRASTRPSPG